MSALSRGVSSDATLGERTLIDEWKRQFMLDDGTASSSLSCEKPVQSERDSRANGCRCSRGTIEEKSALFLCSDSLLTRQPALGIVPSD